MDANERELIQRKYEELLTSYRPFEAKAQHIQDVVRGIENILSDEPRNTDCTVMTDDQILAAKTNLFRFADEFINE